MLIEIYDGSVFELSCDTIIIGLSEKAIHPADITGIIDNNLSGLLSEIKSENQDYTNYGEVNILSVTSPFKFKKILLVGLGKIEDLTLDKVRALFGHAARLARKQRAQSVAAVLPNIESFESIDVAKCAVEGMILGHYKFLYYKTTKTNNTDITKFTIINTQSNENELMNQALENSKIIAESVNFARDLVNHPACYITPTKLAKYAAEIADEDNLDLSILDRSHMKQLGLDALLAVAQGSTENPQLIVLKYTGDETSKEFIAYVGKGVTFDSGGISLKPSERMGEMKGDMAGGAAVLAAMRAIAKLKPMANIIAVIPCVENMPSGCALKPGDVIKSMAGYTIEIITTDAEGRLLLADAITYCKKLGATKIVDVATLTGACVVALGSVASGVITNNEAWCNQILKSASCCGEKMWQLPAYDEYKEQIKSDIADLKNSGGRMAGAITAGLFLEKFADNTPWAHIDIAGTSDIESDKGYNVKGATGAAVRTLIHLAVNQ
ncbi:leucyl aminopeptidase [Dendrosporobacter sp. 1207_IL3150]|uniref:leucyl aminopeptidase n=1 Tax=Dendrosporobacter sp. 1207_IL3150 TaxID=3084054 RepID=UPI002FD9D21D